MLLTKADLEWQLAPRKEEGRVKGQVFSIQADIPQKCENLNSAVLNSAERIVTVELY